MISWLVFSHTMKALWHWRRNTQLDFTPLILTSKSEYPEKQLRLLAIRIEHLLFLTNPIFLNGISEKSCRIAILAVIQV